LLEPASRIERAILEHAGLVESKKSIDAQLLSALESMSDSEKRALLFSIVNSNGGLNVRK
ncbi:integrase, partial [Escherichia coli]